MINFLDFFINTDDNDLYIRAVARGKISLTDKEIIIDPSFLYYLQTAEIQESGFTFYLPDTILNLIERAREGEQERAFLTGFLNFWGQKRYKESNADWNLFFENMSRMKIVAITDEMIAAGEETSEMNFFLEQFVNHPFYTTFSPLKNVLGDCVGKIILFSKKTGQKILSKTRRLSKLLREKITVLELPKRYSETLELKRNFTAKLTKKLPGKENTKFFIGLGIAVGGMWWTPLGVAGIAYAFLDP